MLYFPPFSFQTSERTPCILFHLHAFSWSFITLQTLYMSLHYVPLITHTFTTYIFIISFIFTYFQEKLSISLIANDSYLFINHHVPVETLYT